MEIKKRKCTKHGLVDHKLEKQNKSGKTRWRCKKCAYDRQLDCILRKKIKLVEIFGGKCSVCGYHRYRCVLEFHHVDPKEKKFEIGKKLYAYSLDRLIVEAKKCDLLCKNCHSELHHKEVLKRRSLEGSGENT